MIIKGKNFVCYNVPGAVVNALYIIIWSLKPLCKKYFYHTYFANEETEAWRIWFLIQGDRLVGMRLAFELRQAGSNPFLYYAVLPALWSFTVSVTSPRNINFILLFLVCLCPKCLEVQIIPLVSVYLMNASHASDTILGSSYPSVNKRQVHWFHGGYILIGGERQQTQTTTKTNVGLY